MSDTMDKLLGSSHEEIKQRTGRSETKKPKKKLNNREAEMRRIKDMYDKLSVANSSFKATLDEDGDEVKKSIFNRFKDTMKMEEWVALILGSGIIVITATIINNYFKAT